MEHRRSAAPDQAGLGVSRHHRGGAGARRFARCGSSRPIRWSPSPIKDVLRQALSNLDFLVVQDGYHPTPTTELADLVLPAAIWGEKEGTYTNSERRVSKVNKAVDAAGRGAIRISTSSWRSREKLGCREELFPGWTLRGRRVRGMAARLKGPPLRLLRHQLRIAGAKKAPTQWPFPEGGESSATAVRRWQVSKLRTAGRS